MLFTKLKSVDNSCFSSVYSLELCWSIPFSYNGGFLIIEADQNPAKEQQYFLKKLPKKGTYTLIILVSNELKVNVGKLGIETFLPGYYVYTGSALGKGATSLPNRLARHLKTLKKKHWHIDFLLSKKEASIKAIVAVSGKQNSECEINQYN